MTLAAGARLGPYEILAPLGAGGMGEVYRAKDTKLGRDVALKVLPEEFFENKESITRFEREAKSLAAVSHPNIAHLYSFEEIPGSPGSPARHLLIMELADGQTLAERLLEGPMALDQLLKTSVEIASALDAAHRSGIVHRDLKPGNVMLTQSGVKLLDFGLAKSAPLSIQASSSTSLPTEVPKNLTQKGTILGTVQYMAPETLEGREADPRSDIFSFGAVLYEMATGRKAFEGKSHASLISAIMRDEPKPISQVQPMTPTVLDRLVLKCLAKDPEERWQSARDVASELAWIRESGSEGISLVRARRPKREVVAWVVAAALGLALAAVWSLGSRASRPALDGAIRFEVPPPNGSAFGVHRLDPFFGLNPVGATFSLSPDGRELAFVASSASGANQIFVRALDSTDPIRIAGSEEASSPFWSPDGAFLAFFADGKLKKISLSGGPPIAICDVARGGTGTWGSDGTIVFSEWGDACALRRVPASGGEASAATRLDASRRETWHFWPVFLPDGRRFLFLNMAGDAWPKGRRGIYLGTLGSLDVRFVAAAESEFAYAPPGFLLLAREGALFAQRFDPDRALTRGDPFVVVPEIETYAPTAVASVSAAGRAPVIAFSARAPASRLVWFDRTGRELGFVRGLDAYTTVRLSPDGKHLAVALIDPRLGTTDIWVHDLERGTAARVTFDPASEMHPVWSPDGRLLFFSGDPGGEMPDLFRTDLTATKTELFLHTGSVKAPADVSPDGRFLLYIEQHGNQRDIAVLPLTGERKPYAFLATPFDETDPRFSPDGRFVAYVSSESGSPEVYVRPFDGSGERRQVSRSGGSAPRWSRNSRELYFFAEGRLMASAVRFDHGFDAGPPVALFSVDFIGDPDYEVGPDGRFLIRSAGPGSHQHGIHIVANWASKLKP